MFEIDNYECSFKKNKSSIYLKFTDKKTFDNYSRHIDIKILEDEIKYKNAVSLEDLVFIFNYNFNEKKIMILKMVDKIVVYFNKIYKFSLILYKE